MVSIVHAFTSGISDDPAAASAGKVLPSHWNAGHTITFTDTKKVAGRNSASGGAAEEVSATQLLDWLGTGAQGQILLRGASSWGLLDIGTNGQILQSNGTTAAWTTLSDVLPFSDASALIKGSSDATKLARFEVDGFTTGVTRVFTLPNRNGTLADDTDLALKANLASPNFSGSPTIGGASIATQDYVNTLGIVPKAVGYCTAAGSGGFNSSFASGCTITNITGGARFTFSSAFANTDYAVLVNCKDTGTGADLNPLITRNASYVEITNATGSRDISIAVYGA